MLIPGLTPGANVTIFNTLSFRERVEMANDKIKYIEYLTLVYKNGDNGIKSIIELTDPNYEYYVIHPEAVKLYPQFFVPESDTDAVVVKNGDLLKDIAERTDNLEFFYDNIRNGNRNQNNRLHCHPAILGSDSNIEDHYRQQFSRYYVNNPIPITKSFIDIEVDNKPINYEFPQPGECPINAVSLILQDKKRVYSFILRNSSNPLIAEFEKEIKQGTVYGEFKELLTEVVGGPNKLAAYELDNLELKFLFYDEDREIDLIADIFRVINQYQPDFLLAWNMAFDIPYIIERIKVLGYNPEDIICHPDFTHKVCNYIVDNGVGVDGEYKELAERGDYACIASYTVFLDQMIHFASRRKGGQKYTSYSLDFIGEAVAKVRKLNYKNITQVLGELPYIDFKTFIFYNIIDTIAQYCIEHKTKDVDYLYAKALKNDTRYNKVHRQTVYLANRGKKEFYKDGYILGNNVNRFNPKPTSKFPGAFVADPERLNDYSKMVLNGRPINVVENCMDFDYKSLYPSVYRQFNIAPNTLIGMLLIEDQVHDKENKCFDPKWYRQGAFMEDFQSNVWLEFCSRWFNFPRYETLLKDVIEYFTKIVVPNAGYLREYNRDGTIDPLIWCVYPETNGLIDPIGQPRLINPLVYEDKYSHIENRPIQLDYSRLEDVLNALKAVPNQQFRI